MAMEVSMCGCSGSGSPKPEEERLLIRDMVDQLKPTPDKFETFYLITHEKVKYLLPEISFSFDKFLLNGQ